MIIFHITLPSITQTPNNSNFFVFPLKVRISGSRLYLLTWYPNNISFSYKSFENEFIPFFILNDSCSGAKFYSGITSSVPDWKNTNCMVWGKWRMCIWSDNGKHMGGDTLGIASRFYIIGMQYGLHSGTKFFMVRKSIQYHINSS